MQDTQWEKDISISGGEWVSNGFKNGAAYGGSAFDVGKKGNPYYDYEITNKTNHRINDVVIVFECEGKGIKSKKWVYEFDVGSLYAGETKAIKVYHWDMFPEEYEDDSTYFSTSSEIKEVTYKQ